MGVKMVTFSFGSVFFACLLAFFFVCVCMRERKVLIFVLRNELGKSLISVVTLQPRQPKFCRHRSCFQKCKFSRVLTCNRRTKNVIEDRLVFFLCSCYLK